MSDHETTAPAENKTNPWVVIAAFAMPPLVIVAFAVVIMAYSSMFSGSKVAADEEAVAARILPVARVEIASANAGAKGSRTGEDIVNAACAACHATGAAGAPKIGDKAAWAPRLGQGLDGLVKSSTAGKNAMPPKGGADVSAIELARAIVFMANKSGASFKEPADKK